MKSFLWRFTFRLLTFLYLVSFILCAPESLLACSPIVEMPAANFSSSEEAEEGVWSCCNKSAEVAAPCFDAFQKYL
jgi:hypothetical protein